MLAFVVKLWDLRSVSTQCVMASLALSCCALLCTLAIVNSLRGGVGERYSDQLLVVNDVSFTVPLPSEYAGDVAQVPGVGAVSAVTWLTGTSGVTEHPLVVMAVDADSYLDVASDLSVWDRAADAWREDPTAVLVGSDAARFLGVTSGSKLPLELPSHVREDGDASAPLRVVGLYESLETDVPAIGILMHRRYLDGMRADMAGRTTMLQVRVEKDAQADTVAASIDDAFAGRAIATRSSARNVFAAEASEKFVSVGAVLRVVAGTLAATLCLAVGSFFYMLVKSKRPAYGLMALLGMGKAGLYAVILAQALVMCVGTALATSVAFYGLQHLAGPLLKFYLPMFAVSVPQIVGVLSLFVLVGAVISVLPSLMIVRESPVRLAGGNA